MERYTNYSIGTQNSIENTMVRKSMDLKISMKPKQLSSHVDHFLKKIMSEHLFDILCRGYRQGQRYKFLAIRD